MIFETHAHYDDGRFDEDRDEILSTLIDNGVEYVVNVGADYNSSIESIKLSEKYNFVYAAIGVHPHDVKELTEDTITKLKEKSKHEKVVAIGEIGLDYYYDNSPRDIQKKWFERQIELAKEVKLPIIIHSRDAAKDTLDIIKCTNAENVGGIVHCYSYGEDIAKIYVDKGFYIGIGGVVTYKNAKKLKEVVEYIPLEFLVLETDAPYLTPVPYRGN